MPGPFSAPSPVSLNPHSPRKGLCYPPLHRGWYHGRESFCVSPRRSLWVAGPGPGPPLTTGPGSSLWCCPVPPSTAPTEVPALLPLQGCPPGPACAQVKPASLSQGTIHPGRLLIETMCGEAGQGGGSSGSRAWPGAWGPWGRRSS